MTARPLNELVEQGWAERIAPGRPTGRRRWARSYGPRLRRATGICPLARMCCAPSHIRSTRCGCSLSGRIPTRRRDTRSGLSFSVAPDVRPLPRSLDNIFTEYGKDLGHPPPATGDLTPWAQRGVMLLNRVLTVRPGTPASHRGKGWEAVTECAIRALVARAQPLVAVLWGRDAATLKPMLDRRQLHVDRIGPSRRRCRRRGGSSDRARSAAPTSCWTKMGADPIDWRLPG